MKTILSFIAVLTLALSIGCNVQTQKPPVDVAVTVQTRNVLNVMEEKSDELEKSVAGAIAGALLAPKDKRGDAALAGSLIGQAAATTKTVKELTTCSFITQTDDGKTVKFTGNAGWGNQTKETLGKCATLTPAERMNIKFYPPDPTFHEKGHYEWEGIIGEVLPDPPAPKPAS